MASTLLELTRTSHEDIERLEQEIVNNLVDDPKTVIIICSLVLIFNLKFHFLIISKKAQRNYSSSTHNQ